jgi:16S rRNA processing protein RimM
MVDNAHRLVVGRLRKPHGLKGDVAVFPLTDTPEEVFVRGREFQMVNLAGEPVGAPMVVERGRGFHRQWLVKFEGVDSRTALEQLPDWRGLFVTVPAETLPVPDDDEVYHHDLVGFAVQLEDETPVGLVSEVYELPSGLTIEVQGPKREFMVPFVKEFIGPIDRTARRLTIRPPKGLIED